MGDRSLDCVVATKWQNKLARGKRGARRPWSAWQMHPHPEGVLEGSSKEGTMNSPNGLMNHAREEAAERSVAILTETF